MSEEAPYFETAHFHRNDNDGACWIYYTVENRPTTVGGPRLRDSAWGKMKIQTVRISDGAIIRTWIQDFQIAGAPYNMAEYPAEGVEVGVQIKAPSPSPAFSGYRNERVGLPYYEGAMIADQVTGAGASAFWDPNYPPQQPL